MAQHYLLGSTFSSKEAHEIMVYLTSEGLFGLMKYRKQRFPDLISRSLARGWQPVCPFSESFPPYQDWGWL